MTARLCFWGDYTDEKAVRIAACTDYHESPLKLDSLGDGRVLVRHFDPRYHVLSPREVDDVRREANAFGWEEAPLAGTFQVTSRVDAGSEARIYGGIDTACEILGWQIKCSYRSESRACCPPRIL